MTLEITTTDEEENAITAARLSFEKINLTNAEWLAEILAEKVKAWTDEAYNRSVAQLGEAARPLPWETRQALIANVQSMIS
jgi:hypothetical protein